MSVRLRGDSNFDRIIEYLQRKLRKDGKSDWDRKYDQLMEEWGPPTKWDDPILNDEEWKEWYNSVMASYRKPRKTRKKVEEQARESEWLEESAREYQRRQAEIQENTRRRFEWQKQKDERLRELQYQFSEHGTHYEEIQRVRGLVNPY